MHQLQASHPVLHWFTEKIIVPFLLLLLALAVLFIVAQVENQISPAPQGCVAVYNDNEAYGASGGDCIDEP